MSIEDKIMKILDNPRYSREKMAQRLRMLFEDEKMPDDLVEAKIRYRTLSEVEDQFPRTSKHKAVLFIQKEKGKSLDTIEKLK